MRGDRLIHYQLLMAQAFNALADAINGSKGFTYTPVAFTQLPATPTAGTVMCIKDSAVTSGVVAPGGFNTVLVWYNGAQWTVIGA